MICLNRGASSQLTLWLALGMIVAGVVHADPAPFDLAGPTVEVEVTRADTTLPASQVPNLQSGDRVWMKAELGEAQSAHYLMIASFLRGSTDPPPANWFYRCETWTGKCADKGLTLTVPKDAQQLLVFLAPETGGDYKTLLDAVRGRREPSYAPRRILIRRSSIMPVCRHILLPCAASATPILRA
jgi:hypothetical protein